MKKLYSKSPSQICKDIQRKVEIRSGKAIQDSNQTRDKEKSSNDGSGANRSLHWIYSTARNLKLRRVKNFYFRFF